jgi:uncharacterized DUF497 family protein
MEFEWDENKRASNIFKHGIDFIDVWQMFDSDYITAQAKLGKDGEQRFLVTGLINGSYVTGVFTMRGDVTRVISIRKARTNEWKQHKALHGG